MKENLETRVGFKTLSVLKDVCEEHIRNNIIKHVYVGELHYLQQYIKLEKYLKIEL